MLKTGITIYLWATFTPLSLSLSLPLTHLLTLGFSLQTHSQSNFSFFSRKANFTQLSKLTINNNEMHNNNNY